MGNSKSGNCPWTTVYNVHGICPLFHEEMLEKFHGQCPQYPGHCPWIPWTLSTHSMGSMDIVHTFHGFHGQCPWILWKMSRMSMESMDFLQTGMSSVLQGPVVQSIVSLTISLRHKFVKQISAKVTNTLLFFVEKM